MVISGFQWLSVVFNGYQGLSVVISGYQWLSVVISGFHVNTIIRCMGYNDGFTCMHGKATAQVP